MIVESKIPSEITSETIVSIKGEVINTDQVDANDVTLTIDSEDFKVEPSYFKFDLTGNYDNEELSKNLNLH